LNIDKALFTPVENRRTFEEVSSKIKALVFEGVLKHGDKFPSEAELAKQSVKCFILKFAQYDKRILALWHSVETKGGE
jgi:hypothetical protein